jgi:heme-degrading monooxygenase HmoA
MFAVIFEVNPKPEQWDTYLGYAKLLRPELEQIDGFIENERFSSLRREGWVLSLSIWRDEKAVVRWRTSARHHDVQQKGRDEVFSDYHLRVGDIVADTACQPAGPCASSGSTAARPSSSHWPKLHPRACPRRPMPRSSPRSSGCLTRRPAPGWWTGMCSKTSINRGNSSY